MHAQVAPNQGLTGNTEQGDGQQIRVPLMSAAQAVEAGIARVPQQPFPQLSGPEQQYLDQVLAVWEQRTDIVETLEANFTRHEMKPTPLTIATGIIKFQKPDKGLFRVDELKSRVDNGPNPEFKVNPRQPFGDYWICDGQWVSILDRNEKKAQRFELPPHERGAAISRSPLPFLFGVKAVEVKQRYWMRPIQPPQGNADVWLEAWPKRADDAGSYSRVQVALDKESVLPKVIVVFMPNYSDNNQHREVFEFTDLKVNEGKIARALFFQQFINVKIPGDWEVVEEPYISPEQRAQQDVVQQGQGSPALTPMRTANPGSPQQRR